MALDNWRLTTFIFLACFVVAIQALKEYLLNK